jgi:hypothetical protein
MTEVIAGHPPPNHINCTFQEDPPDLRGPMKAARRGAGIALSTGFARGITH